VQSPSKTLYAVFLGGDPAKGRLGEDHEVVLVAASDVSEARRLARAKWQGSSRPHVDALRAVTVVDGYRVILHETTDPEADEVDVTYEPSDGWDE
jgi:hypothetical protein